VCVWIHKEVNNKRSEQKEDGKAYSLNFIRDEIGSLFFSNEIFGIFSGIRTKLYYFPNNLIFFHLSPSFLLSIHKDEFDMISFPLSLSSPSASSYVCVFI